jgi:hypothetical protein
MILFWGFLISCSYNTILTSSLAVSNVSPPIRSFRDLLESQEYTLILESSSVTTDYFSLAPEHSTGYTNFKFPQKGTLWVVLTFNVLYFFFFLARCKIGIIIRRR